MANTPNGQYDFIMNTGSAGTLKPKSTLRGRIILVVGGGLVLAILFTILYGVLNRPPENQSQLTRVARQQNRILEAAEMGVKDAQSTAAQNLAITTQLSLTGDQKPLLNALKEQNVSIRLRSDPEVEELFTSAKQSNRFDEVLMEFLQEELEIYQRNLSAAYESTTDKDLRAVLRTQFENAKFLAGAK